MTSLPHEFTKGYAVVMREEDMHILYDLKIIETVSARTPGSLNKLTDILNDWIPNWRADKVARHNGNMYHSIVELE